LADGVCGGAAAMSENFEVYGKLKEGIHIATYTFERASSHLKWMLEGDRWKLGGVFDEPNAFMESLRLDSMRASIEARQDFVKRIKELQPEISNRQIARTIGVNHQTVNNDVRGENSPARSKNANEIKPIFQPNGESSPPPDFSGDGAAKRAISAAKREVEAQQARERAKPRVEDTNFSGGTIEDLERLAASGYRAGAILADPPWPFATWSHVGLSGDSSQENRPQRSRAAPYKTMSHEEIYALPIEVLAAKDCALFLWLVQTQLPQAFELVRRWGFEFKSVAFAWVKGEDAEVIEVPMGTGFWTRAGFEQCWIATRGNPRRLYADVRQVIVEKRRDHSRKPDCTHDRIERLVAGPYMELFARRLHSGWTCWGNEIPSEQTVSVA
jgi:N6-adenosine-specific RNA methylase IME4